MLSLLIDHECNVEGVLPQVDVSGGPGHRSPSKGAFGKCQDSSSASQPCDQGLSEHLVIACLASSITFSVPHSSHRMRNVMLQANP